MLWVGFGQMVNIRILHYIFSNALSVTVAGHQANTCEFAFITVGLYAIKYDILEYQ